MSSTASETPVILDEGHRSALHECRDIALVFFTAQLDDMFNNVNDALWDFADKAETNEFQRRFIDAATVVTGSRSDLEYIYRELISKGFTDFAAGRHIADMFDNVPREYSDKNEMELVSRNAVEEYVAIQNIVDKSKSSCFQQLYALGQRLSLIRGGAKVNDFDIPAGPLHSVYSFSKAIESMELAMDINLVLFFLFEKYVMKEMGTVYEKYNECLAEAGIFPNLKIVAPKVPHSEQSAQEEASEFEGDDESDAEAGVQGGTGERSSGGGSAGGTSGSGQGVTLGEEIFGSICNLLAMRRQQDPLFELHPELNPNAPPVVMASKPTLVAAIGDIQATHSREYKSVSSLGGHDDPDFKVDTAILEQYKQNPFEDQNQLFSGVERRRIPTADLDTIELVGMLFEYVLNDTGLPNIVKALISHLHTPFLKVAVLDQDFLVDDQHVARQLLDMMLDAGRNWVDENHLQQGAYYPMERQVERIIHEFREDISLFSEIMQDFQNDIDMLEQKAMAAEERAREAERGRDRLEAARRQAKSVIVARIGKRKLPVAMKRFLFQIWMYRMTLMLVRNPNAEQTDAWERTIMIIDTLLWSLGAQKDPAKRKKLREIFPALKRRIEKGLASVSDYYEPEAQALFDLLLSYQKEKVQPKVEEKQQVVVEQKVEADQQAAVAEEVEGSQEQEIVADQPVAESLEQSQVESVADQPVADSLEQSQVESVADSSDVSLEHDLEAEEDIEDMASDIDEEPLTPQEEVMALRLRNTEFGTWFQFDGEDTDKPLKAKLSWFSPLTKRYMFVDRNGVQVAVKPLKTLVREMSEDISRIIEPPGMSFFNLAMQSIKEMLERATGPVKTMASRQ